MIQKVMLILMKIRFGLDYGEVKYLQRLILVRFIQIKYSIFVSGFQLAYNFHDQESLWSK